MAPRPLLQSWSPPSPPTKAHCNGTTSTPPKLVATLPPNQSTLQWHHVHSPKVVVTPPNNSTLQCHHVHSPKVGPHPPPQPSHTTMAPCNGTQQWHHVHSTIAHYNGTQQWHHVHSTKVGRHPAPCNGTQQWHHIHSTIAHYNGTLQWHHVHSTIAHYNGTLQWHPAMAPRPLHPAMAFWCHVQCAKVVRRPPPLLEVRTPIAIAIWGIMRSGHFFVGGSLKFFKQIDQCKRVAPGSSAKKPPEPLGGFRHWKGTLQSTNMAMENPHFM